VNIFPVKTQKIVAKTRKLKANWSIDAMNDMQASHGGIGLSDYDWARICQNKRITVEIQKDWNKRRRNNLLDSIKKL